MYSNCTLVLVLYMGKSTVIKVWDLLMQAGKEDTMSFENLFLDVIDGLRKPGIQATLDLQSLDTSTLLLTLQDIQCALDDVSDISGEAYVREVFVPVYTARFALPDSVMVDDGDDAVFPIDPKNETIDVAEMFVQAITLAQPLVKRTPAEEKELADEMTDDWSLDDEDIHLWWTVVIRPADKH